LDFAFTYEKSQQQEVSEKEQENRKLKEKLDGNQNLVLSAEEISDVEKCNDILVERGGFVVECFKEIVSKKRNEWQIRIEDEKCYRHELCILLHLYYLYCGPLTNGDGYIFIDEAQDYSVEEIELISRVNGPKAILNIFGDINQVLNSNRCIKDWVELEESLNAGKYEIKENYRNTVQITEYCNERFGYKHQPIGLDGPVVSTIKYDEIEKQVYDAIEMNEKGRIAFVYKKDDCSFIDELKKTIHKYAGQIFCGNVRDVKGLEFDCVFVFSDNMSKNEMYVSYTRALERLVLVEKEKEVGE
jgi:DNA helicase IV